MKTIDEMTPEEKVKMITQFDGLTERVKLFIWESMKDFFEFYLQSGLLSFSASIASHVYNIKDCESPIEQLLLLAMDNTFCTSRYYAFYKAQYKLNISGNKYRLDFLITIVDDLDSYYKSNNDKKYERYLAVECDGHEFHEKTKQQVQRDKQRDRNLQVAGYPILRFTGSEIYKDPMKCAGEIEAYILSTRGNQI